MRSMVKTASATPADIRLEYQEAGDEYRTQEQEVEQVTSTHQENADEQ